MTTWIVRIVPLALFACSPASKEVGKTDDDSTGVADTGVATDAATDATSVDDVPSSSGGSDTGTAACGVDEPVGGGAWQCADNGHTHQKDPAQCDAVAWEACTEPGGGCTSNDDCSPGRVCAQLWVEIDGAEPQCGCLEAPCATTEDCPDGFSCFCGASPRGLCEPSNCITDADCGDELCATSSDACGVGGLYCTSQEDECDGNDFPCTWDPEAGHFTEAGAIGCP